MTGRSRGRKAWFAAAVALPLVLVDDGPIPPAAQKSVDRALVWLLNAQNPDGSWGDNPGDAGEIGNTCIATLALLGTGDRPTRGRYYRPIRKSLDWLRRKTKGYGITHEGLDNGTLLQRKLGANIDLYLMTLLYSQVMGQATDSYDEELMRKEMRFAVDKIASLQKSNGEWETSYEPMLTTITAWLSLRQAHDAGISIKRASPRKVVKYLKTECLEKTTGIFREKKWNNQMRFVTQSGGLRVLYGMGEGDSPEAQAATKVVLRMKFDQDVGGRSGGEEFLGAVFATQALHIEREAAWKQWYPKIVKSLIACQNRDGSWVGHHCITGRVFCTSCSILTMLTPNKMLPMIEL